LREAVELVALFALLVNVGVAAYIIYRDPKRLANRIFAVIAGILAVTSIGEFIMAAAGDPATAMWGSRIVVAEWLVMGAVFINFALVVTGRSGSRGWKYLVVLYTICAAFFVMALTTHLVVRGIAFSPAQINMNHEIPGALWWPANTAAMVLLFSAVAILFVGSRSESRTTRTSLYYVMAAGIIPVVSIGMFCVILPQFNVRLPLGYAYLTPFLAIMITYAITRYDLMTTVGSQLGDTTIRSIREAVLIAGDNSTIEIANQVAAGLTGYGEDELVGMRLETLLARRRGRRRRAG